MSKLRIVLAALLAAFALLTLADRFVLVELLIRRVGLPLIVAAIEVLAAIGAGFLIRRMRGPVDPVLDLILGYPVFGTLCFLAGALYVSTWTMVPVVAACAVFAAYAMSARGVRWGHVGARELGPSVFVFACALVAALAPPSSLDELAYHLAVPKQWLLEHRAIELPLLSHSYFPLGIESADLPSLAVLGNDGGLASHLLHLACAVAVALLIHRRTRDPLVTAAIVSTPALAIAAGWSLVDWPLLGSCVALFIALQDDDDVTASAAIGAGLLTKYTFIPFALLALVAARKWRPAISGAAIGSVFFIRNLILTGNPIAPFLGAAAPHVTHYRGTAYLADYIFDGRFVDEALGAGLLALLPLVAGSIALVLLAGGIAFFFAAPSSRLLVPFLAVPAMEAKPKRWMRALLVVAVVLQTLIVVWFTDRTAAFGVIAGMSDEAYLTKARPSYASIAWLNATLPRDSRTLVIGTGETFWFDRRVRGGGNFDSERMSRYLDVPSLDALRERLRRDGITHIAVITTTAPRTSVAEKNEERQTLLTPAAQRMLAQLLDRYTSSVTARGAATLFTLRP